MVTVSFHMHDNSWPDPAGLGYACLVGKCLDSADS